MRYFLDKNITLRRLKIKSGDRSVYSATGTAYVASWQEPSIERRQYFEGIIGQPYEVFVEENCPVDVGWQVVKDNSIYSVAEIKVVDFGTQHFKKLIVTKHD